ncbi:hypothetical protein AAGS61_07265 [Lysinibacillus sp. KU-BSD001]|uniref:hypothetical protein n=1 Tax=Lysinibacillus sp. KU-BSD001 TaxID=3141328 RepID=UPI0036EBBB09
MAMYFSMYWHFIMMVVLVMVFSGVIGFRFPRFPFYMVLIASGIIGYVYSVLTNLEELFFVFIIANVYMSLVPIVLIEWAMYMRKKADEIEMHMSLVQK